MCSSFNLVGLGQSAAFSITFFFFFLFLTPAYNMINTDSVRDFMEKAFSHIFKRAFRRFGLYASSFFF